MALDDVCRALGDPADSSRRSEYEKALSHDSAGAGSVASAFVTALVHSMRCAPQGGAGQ